MKKNLSILGLLVLISLSFSCKKFDKAEKKAAEFYSFMKEGEYEKSYDLISLDEFKNVSKEEWISVFEQREKAYGKVISYEQTFSGFSNYGKGTVIELRFTVKNEDGTTYEILKFLKKDEQMKIVFYSYTDNPDFKKTASTDDELEKDLESFPAQERIAEKFYALTKQGKFDELQSLMSKEAMDYIGQDGWNEFIATKNETFGKLKTYKLIKSKETKEEDGDRIILFYELKYENYPKVFEKFIFNKDVDPDRISYYQYSDDVEKL